MRDLILSILIFLLVFGAAAQPFRYITGTEGQRDSIRLLRIHGYKEFIAPYNDTTARSLKTIVEYDRNGNTIRYYRHDIASGNNNQDTWVYDDKNRIIEHATYFPDSITYLQQFFFCFDERGNQTEYIARNFNQGKFIAQTRTVWEYDSNNRILSIKSYSKNGLTNHYEYVYNERGNRIEELVYSPEGKLLWRRPSSDYQEREEPYGFPAENDPEIDALFLETTTIDAKSGLKTISNGYGYHVFNRQNILMMWYETNFRYHWFDYFYY